VLGVNSKFEYRNPKHIAKSDFDDRIFDSRTRKSSLCVADVMFLDAFRQQTFAAPLPPTRKGRATAFGTHPGTETVLTFACPLRWLVSPFHKGEN
jgi:hypothetical protein